MISIPATAAFGFSYKNTGILLAFLLAYSASALVAAEEKVSFDGHIRPLLDQYCFKCHSGTKPKAGVSLSQFKDDMAVYRDPRLWDSVLKQLRDREMPPDGKPQPTPDERDRLIDWVTLKLDNLEHGLIPKDPGPALIHRLSRTEYNNSIRDLFGVDSKPADKFPTDGGGGGGFDNNASTLFVPPILMERYLAAAAEILDETRPDRIFIVQPRFFNSKRARARKIIEHFAPLIFRRPVERDEALRYLAVFDASLQRGEPYETGVKTALKGLLISPNFLFRIEASQPGDAPYRIKDYELASRLSYFLWSSMPDEELFTLAEHQLLSDPTILEGQVRRMIRDPKARAFEDNFASQWLGVRSLKTSALPDPTRYPEFKPSLRDAMIEEPIAVFQALVSEDASLLKLLDSNETFVNEELASLYGLSGVTGAQMRRVSLTDGNRGGVLGMAGILTLTSYPLRTSPVLRGKWVLEEILGTPPPPPPAMVKSLPQDDKPQEGLTFRQQLEKHRIEPACANCHKRMDPLGFGLENFDAIGRWRTEISKEKVDASGEMVTGEKFNGPAELRKILLSHKDEFARNLTEKMLSYALGRGLEYYDTPTVRDIARTLAQNDYRSLKLVTEIVKSYPFQYRRDRPVPMTAELNLSQPQKTEKTEPNPQGPASLTKAQL